MAQNQSNNPAECGTNDKSSLSDMVSGSSATHSPSCLARCSHTALLISKAVLDHGRCVEPAVKLHKAKLTRIPQWLFIIFGIMTLLWAGVLLWFLPDTPSTARWLTPEEREKAVDRIRSNQTGVKNNTFKWDQAFEALTDIKVWLIVLYQLANSIPNGAYTTFSSLVVKGLGFSRLEVYLLQIPTGAIHAIFALGSTFICSKVKHSRCLTAASVSIVSLIGSILVRFGPNVGSNLVGFFFFIAYAAGIPISLSMITSNVAGFTKKAVTSAMMFIAYCAGNIIGPFLFFPSEAPTYSVSCVVLLWSKRC